ncbi:MAG: DNA translocase FtsK [candidate division Zixibacteria bacterium]|nr:DNA translocase FtsK [candidate division Zixibacteria bacterium]
MASKKKMKAIRKSRLLALLLFICGMLIAVSLATHNQTNDSTLLMDTVAKSEYGNLLGSHLENRGGIIGVIIAYGILSVFGYLGLFIPLGIWSIAYCSFFSRSLLPTLKKIGYTAMFLYFVGLFFSLNSADRAFVSIDPGLGGMIGHYSAKVLQILTGTLISYTIVISLILGCMILVLPTGFGKRGQAILNLFVSLKEKIYGLGSSLKQKKDKRRKPKIKPEPEVADEPGLFQRIIRIKKPKKKSIKVAASEQDELYPADEEFEGQFAEEDLFAAGAENNQQPQPQPPAETAVAGDDSIAGGNGYLYPSEELLKAPPDDDSTVSKQELESTAEILKDTLATFGVRLANGEVEIYPGPIITRYEFKPAPGVKISQIVNLADDLALAMKAKRIRIVAPIPGKSAVGVEIPNRLGRIVYLREIITSDVFQNSNYMLPLALGKTISGQPHVVDLASMPHLLIAGATGTGKSVCLNCIITSMLYKKSPDILRLILIDPKMLELSVYNDLLHLEKPVVTEMKYAEKVLAEAVVEMEERYRRLAKVGVRNIADYNESADEPIPYVVIIVDELADLMMIGSNRVETLITRLAQMARAVGIHLILATQRPSVDVITGLIKANFSTRIAFQVATKVDSRTILDINGAEKLLGRGDMLYMNPAFPEPKRVHGAFISSPETKAVCNSMGKQEYEPKRIKNFESNDKSVSQYDPAADAIYKEAVKMVIRHKQGSVSLLQRRLGIGYQRAARLIDQLEESGIVGPYDGSKAREVLVDEQYLQEVFNEEI